MKKIMLVFGTRPEAIKMAPLVKEFQKRPEKFKTIVCVTGQHREMLDQVLRIFDIIPNYDLNIMKQNTERLLSLTNQLLDFRKTESQGFRLNFAECNVTEVLKETYNRFTSLARQRELDFVLNVADISICFCVIHGIPHMQGIDCCHTHIVNKRCISHFGCLCCYAGRLLLVDNAEFIYPHSNQRHHNHQNQ